LAFGGNVNVCVPVTNTTNVTICASALPYTWGSQTIVAAGTYTNSAINAAGCDSVETLNLTVNPCANSILDLKCYIQGYYAGAGLMISALANQGETSSLTACDSIDVELRNETSPFALVASSRVVLNTDGTAQCSFPSLTGNNYIVVKHRSAVQTWSGLPVSFATSPVSYDFSTAESQAYGAGGIPTAQKEVASGVWAIYSGDIIVDENVDLLDLGIVETDISEFAFGYNYNISNTNYPGIISTDINGDGNVDLLDSPILETNISEFIYSNHP
jgi:hypothetical protein